jgi:hypothetical protein
VQKDRSQFTWKFAAPMEAIGKLFRQWSRKLPKSAAKSQSLPKARLIARPGPVRTGQWPAPAILQASFSELPVAAGPARTRWDQNVEPLSSPGATASDQPL